MSHFKAKMNLIRFPASVRLSVRPIRRRLTLFRQYIMYLHQLASLS